MNENTTKPASSASVIQRPRRWSQRSHPVPSMNTTAGLAPSGGVSKSRSATAKGTGSQRWMLGSPSGSGTSPPPICV